MLKQRVASALKSPRVKQLLYRSGLLDAYHRRRNRDALTVVMFHRVLSESDPRWQTCDPEYTVSDRLFADCLRFFRKHYSVISMAQLMAAQRGDQPLPPRPLLITFDDGWSDNEEFALPALRRESLPAVIFIVSDVVGRQQPFWQECLMSAWRGGRLQPADLDALWNGAGSNGAGRAAPDWPRDRDEIEALRELIARLEELDDARRDELLGELGDRLDDGVRHMVTAEQLRSLAEGGFAIGAHGKTHTPLLRAADPEAELAESREALASHLGRAPETMSFPHGSHDARLVAAAHERGYRLLFTSVSELAPVTELPACLPRVGFTQEGVAGQDGRLAPELLALLLFRKARSS